MKRALVLAGIGSVLSSACALQQPNDSSAAIAANVQRFVAAFNRGDAAGVAGIYTEDALVRLQGAPEAIGREQIVAFWQHGIKPGLQLELKTTELNVAGNWAYELGHATITNADGGTAVDQSYLAIWKRIGGEWRLHRDFANSTPVMPNVSKGS